MQPEAVRIVLAVDQVLDVAPDAARAWGETGPGGNRATEGAPAAGDPRTAPRLMFTPISSRIQVLMFTALRSERTHYCESFSKNVLVSSSVRGRILARVRAASW
jgi:hypothetical protein